PEGALISAKEFLHLGSRAAVDQALKRLRERKELMRLGRGVYVRPIKTRFGTRAPAAEKVVERLAATRAETIAHHGAAAANALGLTTQVPTKLVYLTSGRTRRLKLGAQVVEMKHAPQWMLLPSQPVAGEAIRALAWLGKGRAGEALTALKSKLPTATLEELVALRPALPSWMSKSISQALVSHG
ncbi:MAG: type IV toxin-antitoxin system AbiEi family antitoxin domain-containing protein, partial [Hyphomicrobiales bacterium]|nr:type IV toxin-antitoxin system AbiEi family antitoxin domain-containing protein [Hyphomicrobiales bacterium]